METNFSILFFFQIALKRTTTFRALGTPTILLRQEVCQQGDGCIPQEDFGDDGITTESLSEADLDPTTDVPGIFKTFFMTIKFLCCISIILDRPKKLIKT